MSQWIKILNAGRNICSNFISVGAPYNYSTFSTNSNTLDTVTGELYTGWNLAPINPSDDSLSIKLSSGSPITITLSNHCCTSVITWKAVKDKSNLSTGQQISFDLFSGNTAFQSFIFNGGGSIQRFSGYLPKEYDRLIIRYLEGGGEKALVNVSGNFGFYPESSNCLKITNVGTNICTANPTNCIKINDVRKQKTWDIGIQTVSSNQIFKIFIGIQNNFGNFITTNPNITVDWGDGQVQTFLTNGFKPHTYVNPGNYTVKINGSFGGNGSISIQNDVIDQQDNLVKSTSTIPFIPGLTSFSRTFHRQKSLTTVPEGLFANNPQATSFEECFYQCNSLNNIPANLFTNNTLATNFFKTFGFCTSLTSIPATLFVNNTLATNFDSCFFGCSSLTEIPNVLFNNNVEVTSFDFCFNSIFLTTTSYSNLLINLASNAAQLPNNVPFGANQSRYNLAGQTARQTLQAKGWIFNDLGLQT